VIRIVSLNQVLHDASRLEEIDRLAIGKGVGQGGDPAIRVDGAEPGLLLGVFADIDFVDFVGQTVEGISCCVDDAGTPCSYVNPELFIPSELVIIHKCEHDNVATRGDTLEH
jgi:hypothetical protein